MRKVALEEVIVNRKSGRDRREAEEEKVLSLLNSFGNSGRSSLSKRQLVLLQQRAAKNTYNTVKVKSTDIYQSR